MHACTEQLDSQIWKQSMTLYSYNIILSGKIVQGWPNMACININIILIIIDL